MKKAFLFFILIFSFLTFLCTNCASNSRSDDDGENLASLGQDGQEVVDDTDDDTDATADPGVNCWDLNENGTKDKDSEDLNNDSFVNVLDCSALCWDLNKNGVKDYTSEDKNEDGEVDAGDCTPDTAYCVDDDGDGFCDLAGGPGICDPDDDNCIDPCEGGTITSPDNCAESCLASFTDHEDQCTHFDIETGEEITGTPEACELLCADACEGYEIAPEECPPSYIIPNYYKSMQVTVSQCTPFNDYLVVADRYLKFESMTPTNTKINFWNYFDLFGDYISSDIASVGESYLCTIPEEGKFYRKAYVEIEGLDDELVWSSPSTDYFEYYNFIEDIDGSDPMFLTEFRFEGTDTYRLPRVQNNYHRNGQLSFSIEYRMLLGLNSSSWNSYHLFTRANDDDPPIIPTTSKFKVWYKPIPETLE